MMQLIFDHFWIVFFAVTFAIAAYWWRSGKGHRDRDPGLTDGYRKLVKGLVIWSNIPWVVMAAGILFGDVPSIRSYFNPNDRDPWVLAFFASVFVVWVAGTYWLFAANGAAQIVRHPGLFRYEIRSPALIKVLWLLGVAGGIVAAVVMFRTNMPRPQ